MVFDNSQEEYILQGVTEEDMTKWMWTSLMQYGVIVDNITDEGEVFFTVPSHSEYYVDAVPPIFGSDVSIVKQEMCGELLLQLAQSYFEENGLIAKGGVRDEKWTTSQGNIELMKAENEVDQNLTLQLF